MAWYPGATRYELQPESDSQPAIRPTQFIVHSIIAPWTAKRTYEFWRDSTNLESHFGLGYEGDLGQFIGTETRADANAGANRRPDGTGAVSLESASNLQGTDPWTDAQVRELIELGVWLHQRHGIPLRLCRTHSDPGFGYHSMFPQWSTSGTACPGKARIAQFKTVVFPGIVARATGQPTTVPEEDDMPTAKEVAAAVLAEIKANPVVLYDAVMRTDRATPPAGKESKENPTWAMESVAREAAGRAAGAEAVALRVEQKVAQLEQHQLTSDQITAIATAVAQHPALAEAIADNLAARLKD